MGWLNLRRMKSLRYLLLTLSIFCLWQTKNSENWEIWREFDKIVKSSYCRAINDCCWWWACWRWSLRSEILVCWSNCGSAISKSPKLVSISRLRLCSAFIVKLKAGSARTEFKHELSTCEQLVTSMRLEDSACRDVPGWLLCLTDWFRIWLLLGRDWGLWGGKHCWCCCWKGSCLISCFRTGLLRDVDCERWSGGKFIVVPDPGFIIWDNLFSGKKYPFTWMLPVSILEACKWLICCCCGCWEWWWFWWWWCIWLLVEGSRRIWWLESDGSCFTSCFIWICAGAEFCLWIWCWCLGALTGRCTGGGGDICIGEGNWLEEETRRDCCWWFCCVCEEWEGKWEGSCVVGWEVAREVLGGTSFWTGTWGLFCGEGEDFAAECEFFSVLWCDVRFLRDCEASFFSQADTNVTFSPLCICSRCSWKWNELKNPLDEFTSLWSAVKNKLEKSGSPDPFSFASFALSIPIW